ncbi:MAG: response regulator transcription factor [Defluviitaleaceae bacterium]|nr:response regulator transcription factor [Defluviitaleaceae bacterium]
MTDMIAHILLVEDDAIIAAGLLYALQQEGYAVRHEATVRGALTAATSAAFDLALLDMQLPDGTGFDVRCKLSGDVSVIFLTVVDDEAHIVRAFEGGADDYVTKPFRLRELTARIRRTLEKKRSGDAALHWGAVTVDTAAGKAYIHGQRLDLTALEYRLLLTLAMHRGRILSRAQILSALWDAAGQFVEDNTLSVYMKRLREKLGDAARIETIRGQGYRVAE